MVAAFVDENADRIAEVAWLAAAAWLERAAVEAREAVDGRFRVHPAGELRRLRRNVAGALTIARFAASASELERNLVADLTAEARAEAELAAAARRRRGTLEAERVRLLRGSCRREGREPTADELYGSSGDTPAK